jgi:hypothetical protein
MAVFRSKMWADLMVHLISDQPNRRSSSSTASPRIPLTAFLHLTQDLAGADLGPHSDLGRIADQPSHSL